MEEARARGLDEVSRMRAFYNDSDPFISAWLKNLVAAGRLSGGVVDGRDFRELRADDVSGFQRCHFFAGIGGWDLALELAGWPRDREIWTASLPCQPFSKAGKKLGEGDERHLFPDFAKLVAECSPSAICGEQVSSKDGRLWLAGVRSQMEQMGYRFVAADLCASGFGSPHIRQRFFWMAYASNDNRRTGERGEEAGAREEAIGRRRSSSGRDHGRMEDAERIGRRGGSDGDPGSSSSCLWGDDWIRCSDGKVRRLKSGIVPLAHDVPGRMGILRGYGNAIVPIVAAEFLMACMGAENDMMRSDEEDSR